jgi:NADPH:quinone reductase-like Zn-dependent oxidoreductase
MTRAVVATAFGGPEVLAVIQTPVGSPGPGEALVSVRAAGTNPIDYKLYSGAMGQDTARLPIRLGFEAAGVVTEVADGAEGPGGPVRVGDEVIAYRINGAYAADVTVPLSSVIPRPSPLSFEEASGMMLTGVTAAHAYRGRGGRGRNRPDPRRHGRGRPDGRTARGGRRSAGDRHGEPGRA